MVKRVKKRNFPARAPAVILFRQAVAEAKEKAKEDCQVQTEMDSDETVIEKLAQEYWIDRNNSLHREATTRNELSGVTPMDLNHPMSSINPDLIPKEWFNRNTLLHMAAIGNARGIEQLFICKKENIEVRDRNGYTPLHLAVKAGHVRTVQKLVELNADVQAKYSHARTPLHLVGEFGRRSSSSAILKALIDRGKPSDLLVHDRADDTPLHLAALNGNPEVLKDMLEYLSMSTSSENSSSEGPCISTVNLNLPNKEGRTPLHFAAGKGNVEATRLLLGKKASKDARDVYGATPFHFAARFGNVEVLKLLRLKDVNNRATNTQMTALHYAVWNGRTEAILWLLAQRASVNVKDAIEGDTPLHWAARKGNPQIVEILIIDGHAKPELTNNNGELALGLADEGDHRDAAKAFVRAITRKGQKKIRGSLWTKHDTNGATWLHYFGAYGIEEDLKWILALIERQAPSNVGTKGVNIVDKFDRTVVHWAAMKGNKDVVRILAQKKVNLNVMSPYYHATPLAVALINKEMAFAEELMQHKPKDSNGDNWLRDVKLNLMQIQDANLEKKFVSLREEYKPYDRTHGSVDLFFEVPTIYLAIYLDRDDIGLFIQKHSRGVEAGVNERGGKSKRTALHWATLLRQREIVAQLCKTDQVFAHALTANVEDGSGMTALQYSKQFGFKDIENELMQRNDVRAYMEVMYKDRQVYVDATNAILVGAALIASVTFAGWLQPPLNYTPYYNLPQLPPPSPPDIFQSYAAIQQNMGVRFFWVFNSLSFSFAIATVLAGLVGVVPIPRIYIATTVAHLRHCLLIAAAFLGLSIVFVLAAFAAAGFAVLPPLFEYQAYMMATVIVGGIPCLLLLAQFACRLWSLRPDWVRAIEIKVLSNLCPGCTRPDETLNASQSPSAVDAQSMKFQGKNKYIVGNDYDTMPWDDGLNLPPQS